MPSIVSIVIPCYQQARFLEGCVQSLRAQTYPHWEAVIVDDGSREDAAEIGAGLGRLDSRVRFMRQENAGPSAARNTGMRATSGVYVQFLDADDLFKPDKLQRHVAMLDADGELDLVYGNAWYFDDENPERRFRQGFGPDPDDDWIAKAAALPMSPLLQLVQHNTMPICAPLFRRSLVERAGPMNESMRALEDWEFWIRCANTGAQIRFDSSPLAECLIRLHAGSASQNREFMINAELAMRILCLSYLQDHKARRLMLALIGRLVSGPECAARRSTLEQLHVNASGMEERIALWVAINLGQGTRLHGLAVPLIRFMPWPIRSLTGV